MGHLGHSLGSDSGHALQRAARLHPIPGFPAPLQIPTGGLHSLSVSNDGQRAFFALLTGGFAVADVSDFANGVPNPQPRRITINENRPHWDGPGAHSAVKFCGA